MWRKTMKHAFSMFYTLIKHGFSTNQSAHRVLSIFKVKLYQYKVCPGLSVKSGEKAGFSAQKECLVDLLARALCNK